MPKNNVWPVAEIEILITYYPKEGGQVIHRLPGRSITSIYAKAHSLKLKSNVVRRPWHLDEERIACRYYLNNGNKSFHQIYEILLLLTQAGFTPRTTRSIHMKLDNYKYLNTGSGLEHIAKKSKKVYEEMTEK